MGSSAISRSAAGRAGSNPCGRNIIRTISIAPLALSALGLLGTIAPAAAFDAKEIGSFHIGGQALTLKGLPIKELVYTAGGPPTKMDPNGDFHSGQMYVQYIKLTNPKARYPLLLWHGGGLTGVTWETKPDGQPGWQMYFLNAGHDVYVSDAVERGRASWSRYPEVYSGEPPPTPWRGKSIPDRDFP